MQCTNNKQAISQTNPTNHHTSNAGNHDGINSPSTARPNWPNSQINPFLNYLCVECGLADNTISAYRRDLEGFARFCANNKLHNPNNITPVIIQNYARHLAQSQLATASIARHMVAVKMFFRYHLLLNLIAKDVCAAIETPKTWQKIPHVLSPNQTLTLINAFKPGEPLYLRNHALLELLYATGIRATEAAQLKINDINPKIAYLRCIGKGHKERIIPIHQQALDSIELYLKQLRPELLGEKPDKQFLFLSRLGQPISRIDIWRIVRQAALRAGLPAHVTPHTLRHCFGSHLLTGGADLRYVQEMLGHADVTTTQIYTHVDQQRLRDMHKKYHPRG